MTKTTFALLCAALAVAGCGEDEKTADRKAAVAAESTVQKGRIDSRRAIVEELQGGEVSPERRAELEAEETRLAEEIRISNNERLRRDREEIRQKISEKKRRGGT